MWWCVLSVVIDTHPTKRRYVTCCTTLGQRRKLKTTSHSLQNTTMFSMAMPFIMILILYVMPCKLSCDFSKLTILYIHAHIFIFMTNKSVMTFLYVKKISVSLSDYNAYVKMQCITMCSKYLQLNCIYIVHYS